MPAHTLSLPATWPRTARGRDMTEVSLEELRAELAPMKDDIAAMKIQLDSLSSVADYPSEGRKQYLLARA